MCVTKLQVLEQVFKSKKMQMSVLAAWVALVFVVQCDATPSPIILIPGLMGSQLNVTDRNEGCTTGPKYKALWVSKLRLIKQCAKDELRLQYHPETNSYHNNSGVKIAVPGFGNTRSVEYLDHILFRIFPYFHRMVTYFVNRGYERGKNIRGAPYDWRLAADELEKRGYFNHLKSLVEDTYQRNGNTKVTLVVHSMGGLVSLHFLTGFSGINQDWKNKYIHAYVPLSAAWSGGVATLEGVISGYHGLPDWLEFAYKTVGNFITPLSRTFESMPWLFPKPSVFGDEVLVSTPSKNYTASDYEQLFRDIDVPNIYRAYESVQAINPNYPAPNVPTYCFYGVGVDTPKTLFFQDFTAHNPIGIRPKEVSYGKGDGSVNLDSLEVCQKWSSMPSKFENKTYDKVEHMKILSDKNVLKDIGEIVGAPKKRTRNRFFKTVVRKILKNLFSG